MDELLLTEDMIAKDHRLRFKLKNGVHWWWNDEKNIPPVRFKSAIRVLRPEVQEWLDDMDFPHTLIMRRRSAEIWFEDYNQMMVFKLAWYKPTQRI